MRSIDFAICGSRGSRFTSARCSAADKKSREIRRDRFERRCRVARSSDPDRSGTLAQGSSISQPRSPLDDRSHVSHDFQRFLIARLVRESSRRKLTLLPARFSFGFRARVGDQDDSARRRAHCASCRVRSAPSGFDLFRKYFRKLDIGWGIVSLAASAEILRSDHVTFVDSDNSQRPLTVRIYGLSVAFNARESASYLISEL